MNIKELLTKNHTKLSNKILSKCLIILNFCINLIQAHAIGLRGEKQGLSLEIIRIVLQTLTFTSGT